MGSGTITVCPFVFLLTRQEQYALSDPELVERESNGSPSQFQEGSPMLQRIRAGTSGFRGVTNGDITVAHALAIGERYGALLAERLGRRPTVTVGHDQRFGAEALAQAVAAGFMAASVDVIMLGCVPTGVYCVCSAGYDGGVLVTGSHMPPDRIGIIPMNADGTYATADVTDPIEAAIVEYPERRWTVAWDQVGRLTGSVTQPILDGMYLQQTLWRGSRSQRATEATRRGVLPSRATLDSRFDLNALYRRKFRVLIDSGNGTAGRTARLLLEAIGCEVEGIHESPKPMPDRPSECRASSCVKAIARMLVPALNEPIGVIGIRAPNEWPLLGLVGTIGPAIAMGNTVVIVAGAHALTASDLVQVIQNSDVPGGVVNVLTAEQPDAVAKMLAEHRDVDAVWCFGSAEACAKVEAGSTSNMKRTWVGNGKPLDWMGVFGTSKAFLREATQPKNVWVPFGA